MQVIKCDMSNYSAVWRSRRLARLTPGQDDTKLAAEDGRDQIGLTSRTAAAQSVQDKLKRNSRHEQLRSSASVKFVLEEVEKNVPRLFVANE